MQKTMLELGGILTTPSTHACKIFTSTIPMHHQRHIAINSTLAAVLNEPSLKRHLMQRAAADGVLVLHHGLEASN